MSFKKVFLKRDIDWKLFRLKWKMALREDLLHPQQWQASYYDIIHTLSFLLPLLLCLPFFLYLSLTPSLTVSSYLSLTPSLTVSPYLSLTPSLTVSPYLSLTPSRNLTFSTLLPLLFYFLYPSLFTPFIHNFLLPL